jgi:hypothetical protein
MKTSLEIINKLSEKEAVKLESEKVELAMFKSVQEIEKQYAALLAKSNEASRYVKTINDAKIGLNNLGKSLNVLSDAFIKDANSTITEAKALGLQAPASVTNLPGFAKGIKNKANSLFKLANAIDSNIKGL